MADQVKAAQEISSDVAIARAGMTQHDVTKWQDRIKQAVELRNPWLNNANAAKNLRLGRDTDTGQKDGADKRFRLTVNLLQLRYLGRIASQVSRDPTFHCFGTTPQSGRSDLSGYRLEISEGWLKFIWRKQRIKRVMRQIVADGVDYSRGIVMVDYLPQNEMVPASEPIDFSEEEERSPGPGKRDLLRHEDRLVADTVVTIRIDPRRILFDVGAPSLMDSPWIAIEFRRDREDVLKTSSWLNPEVALQVATLSLEDLSERGTLTDEEQAAIATRGGMIDLYDVWDKSSGRRLTFVKGHMELGPLHSRPWLPGLETKVPVQLPDGMVRLVMTERSYPIEVYEPRADNDEQFSRPDAQDLIGLQRAVTELRRLQYDQTVASLPRLVGKLGQVSQADIDKWLSDPNHRFINLENPQEAHWSSPPQMGASLDQAAQSMKFVFDEQSTMPAMSRGTPTDHQISATEAAITDSGQKSISELDQEELESLMTRVAEKQLRVGAANLKKPFSFAVHVGQSVKPFTITGADLDASCLVQIERNGTRYYDQEFMEQKTIGRINGYMTTFGEHVSPMEIRRLKEIMIDQFGWSQEGVLTPIPEQYHAFADQVLKMLSEGGMAPDQVIETFMEEMIRANADLAEAEQTAMIRDMRDMAREAKLPMDIMKDTIPPPAPAKSGGGK